MPKKITSCKQVIEGPRPDFNQQVYQDPITRGLFTFKRTEGDKVVIGGGCGFYSSAITGLMRYSVPKEYFNAFIPIGKDSPRLEVATSIAFKSYKPLKVKKWDCIKDDYISRAIRNSSQLELLSDETNQLVEVGMKEFSHA